MPRKIHGSFFIPALPLLVSSVFGVIAAPVYAQAPTPAPTPAPLTAPHTTATDDPMARIRDEGVNNSQIVPTLSYLSDVIGARLTGSPSMKRANKWTADKLTSWGMSNAHLEAWGPFGRGWTSERFSVQMVSPINLPLIAYPKAWSPGLKGTLTAPVVYFDAAKMEDLAKYKGKLKGAIVLTSVIRDVPARYEPQGSRYTDDDLQKMAAATPADNERRGGPGGGRPGGPGGPGAADFRAQQEFARAKSQFLYDEGAAVLIDSGRNGDDGTVFVQSASLPPSATPPIPATPPAPGTPPAPRKSIWDKDSEKLKTIPQITMAVEQYNRLARMAQFGEPATLAIDMKVKFYDDDLMSYNTVAEIPGTDKKDEIVMCGAHMDSWHTGTGTTDNGAGDVVCMEALRILKTLNLPLRRTVRIALWSGEEEGLYGSKAYADQHFGTIENGVLKGKPEQSKVSGYFNLDNGSGKVRGIYAQGNEAIEPLFADWLKPFNDLGATTVTIRNTGSTDHISFDAVDVPGFQFIQDTIEYGTRTHHSNMDVYDRAQIDDLKQAAVVLAAFLYNTANRDEMLPRKPIPAPVPRRATP